MNRGLHTLGCHSWAHSSACMGWVSCSVGDPGPRSVVSQCSLKREGSVLGWVRLMGRRLSFLPYWEPSLTFLFVLFTRVSTFLWIESRKSKPNGPKPFLGEKHSSASAENKQPLADPHSPAKSRPCLLLHFLSSPVPSPL
jgi:hypothetical protein